MESTLPKPTKKNPHPHAPPLLPYSNGWLKANGSNALVATYSSYLNSAKSFAAVEQGIVGGVTDRLNLPINLQQKGGFGVGSNGPSPAFVPDAVSIIATFILCLNQ